MTVRLGVLTIGESPRSDALTADMQEALGSGYQLIERGALDTLSDADVAALAPTAGEYTLITLRASGQPVRLSKPKILARLQEQITRLEQEDGVAGTLLMCTGAFPPFQHTRLLLQPQEALYKVVLGLAAGGLPASLTPLPEQVEQTRRKWADMGAPGALSVPANPYGPDPLGEIRAAARQAREQGGTVLFMDCFGYTLAMKEAARDGFGGPVVLARSMAARILAEVTA
ncbi:MAG: AroM family protein [Bacillota bacterium]